MSITPEVLPEHDRFDVAVRCYQGALLRYVRTTLHEEDAQDVVQEVFLKLHKTMRRGGLRDESRLGAWLFRVAHTCTADVLRRKRIDGKALDVLGGEALQEGGTAESGGLDEAVRNEDCRLALTLLNKLPPRERQVLLLKVEDGMTYREIGEVTNLALGTVAYLINQGLQRLARDLKAAGAI